MGKSTKFKLIGAVIAVVGWVLFSAGQVRAQSCSGVVEYCKAPCGQWSTQCTYTCQSCVSCAACSWCSSDQCTEIVCTYDIYGKLIGCEPVWQPDKIACSTTNETHTCPSYVNPCYGGDCAPAPGSGGSGSGPTPTPLPTHKECISSTCTTVNGAGTNQCAVNADCITSYNVTGTVRLGEATWNGANCTAGTGSGVLPGVGSYIRLNSTGTVGIGANGAYTTAVAPGINVLTLYQTDLSYLTTCPPAGSYSRNITGNTANLDFYVTTQQVPWWQTRGGDVGANGGSMASNIPGSCLGGCKPYISLNDQLGTAGSSGVIWMSAMTGTFGVVGSNVTEGTDYKPYGTSVRTTTRREGYDYFYRLFEMGLSPTEDPELAMNENDLFKPIEGPVNARAYYVKAGDGTGTVTIGTTWDLDPGDSIVVFVEGNLNIAAPIITFNDNEFLAFIVSGNITFSQGLAVPNINNPLVQGVFIADGQIITSLSAEQFVGEGIFVGWGGVDLNRDFGDNTNNTNPAEFFSYRPDFVFNAPARMKRPVMRWEEIAP